MQILLDQLQQTISPKAEQDADATGAHHLIVHGLFGVVECQDFVRATKEFVAFLDTFAAATDSHFAPSSSGTEASSELVTPQRQLIVSGESTMEWSQRLEIGKPHARKFVTREDRKMAGVLRAVLAAKPRAMLLHLMASPPIEQAADTSNSAEEDGADVGLNQDAEAN
ncbi:hypothetical protein FI667_g10168, partial [Globisporangium splendens]